MEDKTETVNNKTMDHFLPEARYEKTELENWQKDPRKFIGEIVHVMPIEFLSAQGILFAAGKNFKGRINMDEISIYPLTFFEGSKIPKCVQTIFRLYQCMTAKIIGYEEEKGMFILSRKKVMEEAIRSTRFEAGTQLEACKMGVSGHTTFIDVGAGLTAVIPIAELSASFVENVKDFLKEVKFMPVKIIENNNNRIVCSYKKAFKPRELAVDDIIQGRVMNNTSDNTGVYIEITPLQTGILDLEDFVVIEPGEYTDVKHVVRGQMYTFRIHRIRPQKEGDDRNFKRYCLRLI